MVRTTTESSRHSFSSISSSTLEEMPSKPSNGDLSEASSCHAADRFEGTAIFSDQPDPIENAATFWAHFLLDQQKCANLHIAHSDDLLESALNSEEISKFLATYSELKPGLEGFEKLKRWGSDDRAVHLKTNEDYLMSLLKLVINREDVHLIQWLDVGQQDYESYQMQQQAIQKKIHAKKESLQIEIAKLATLQSQLKNPAKEKEWPLLKSKILSVQEDILQEQRLIKIDEIELGIRQEKMNILKYIFTVQEGAIPLENLKTIVRTKIAPPIHQAKSWLVLGKRCLKLATELTNTAKQFNNSQLPQKRIQLKKDLQEIIKVINQEISQNKELFSLPTPALKDLS